MERARQHTNIELLEQHVAVDLIGRRRLGESGKRCLGAYVLNRNSGEVDTFAARFLSGLRGFYRYLLREGEIAVDPTLRVDLPQIRRASCRERV